MECASWCLEKSLEAIIGARRIQTGARCTHRVWCTQSLPTVQIYNCRGAHPERGALGFVCGAHRQSA